MRLSTSDVSDLFMSAGAFMVAASVLLAVLTAALRLGLRPLLEDWVRIRTQVGSTALERRVAGMEEELRQLQLHASLQLPADLRSGLRPRT